MSMLAEKKRSVKWQLNPRGKSLLEEPNFGKQLLEKMGWKSGQGLGANNQGPTDFVKVKLKNDSEGLGFKKTDDEWLKTTSEFNELLDRLSNDTAEESSDQNHSSLEDRSKKSKARVHYHKFTRGKDLSRYSTKDLASIIGPDSMKQKNGSVLDSDYSSNQVNGGSSEDYFKKKKNDVMSSKISLSKEDSEDAQKHQAVEEICQEIVDIKQQCSQEVITSKSKKKRKKCKEKNEPSLQYNENDSSIVSPEVIEKVKKKKKKEIDTLPTENIIDSVELNQFDDKTEKQTKRQKKRKHEVVEDLQECSNLVGNLQDVDISTSKKKSKKCKDFNLDETYLMLEEHDKSVLKRKKKSSKILEDINDIQNENNSLEVDSLSINEKNKFQNEKSIFTDAQAEELKEKLKKKKKSRQIEDTNISAVEAEQNHEVLMATEQLDTELDGSTNERKSKKKKSRKDKDTEDSVLPKLSTVDSTRPQLESNNEYKDKPSNRIIVKGNIEKTSVIPQKIDLFTESKLVKHRLKTLGIPIPDVEVILNGEEVLQKVSATNAAIRKQNLILYYSTNHWKSLLPTKEVDEIKLARILLTKRRFKCIGLFKDGLEQLEAKLKSKNGKTPVDIPPTKDHSCQKEFLSLLDDMNLLKQQSWDCTEDLKLRKGEQGIVDGRIIDKVNQMFKKPYAPENEPVFSEIENFILLNLPAFLETKLKRLRSLVDSSLAGNISKELTTDSVDKGNAELNSYGLQNGSYNSRSWKNPNTNHQNQHRGFANRRGQGGFQGSVSYRELGYSAHRNVQDYDLENQPTNINRGGRFYRGAENTNVQETGTEINVKITKGKKKKGHIYPSSGNHIRFEPLPQEEQSVVPHFNTAPSFCHFGTVYRRGEGTFRGLLRGRMRQRGKISQTNYEARLYAEQCKAMNKIPELSFNGVDMKKIPGYAASLTPSKPSTQETQT